MVKRSMWRIIWERFQLAPQRPLDLSEDKSLAGSGEHSGLRSAHTFSGITDKTEKGIAEEV